MGTNGWEICQRESSTDSPSLSILYLHSPSCTAVNFSGFSTNKDIKTEPRIFISLEMISNNFDCISCILVKPILYNLCKISLSLVFVGLPLTPQLFRLYLINKSEKIISNSLELLCC